jgi:hypothetical protein
MIKRFLFTVSLLALFAVPAQAGILSSQLNFTDGPDSLNDDSAGVLIKKAGNALPGLQVGDIVQGIINFDQISGVTQGSDSIWGVYSLEVLTGPGGPGTYTLGAVSDATKSVGGAGGLLDQIGVSTAGFNNTGDGVTADALFAIFEKGGTNLVIPDDAAASVDNIIAANGKIGGQVDSSWDLVLTAGFDGVDDTYVINELAPATATFDAAFTVFDHAFGGSVQFLDMASFGLPGVNGNITTNGGFIFPPFGIPGSKNFEFQDRGVFFVNAVPEPGYAAIFGCIIGFAGFVRRRGRQVS